MTTVCGVNQIDSNITGLAIAEEECPKVLPGVNGADAVWYAMEPNTYSTFGGDIKTVARLPINASRQQRKGTVSDLNASAGFNTDVTASNITRLMQGFFFADAREQPATQPINGSQVAITAVDAALGFEAASGLSIFKPTDIVVTKGFNLPGNNNVFVVTTAANGALMTSPAPSTEAAPPAAAQITRVGRQYASGDVSVTMNGGIPSLVATAGVFNDLGLIPGAWLFVGGDGVGFSFANNAGYARVESISADGHTVVLGQTTWTPVAESGVGKTLEIFVGTILRSESDPTLIKKRFYQQERTLGSDATGVQAEYIRGCVANTFTLNVPMADKINADLAYIALDNEQNGGDDGLKPGTRIAAPGEDAINTSSDVYRLRMSVLDPTTSNPSALFGYVTDAKLTINNTATASKAVGVLGGFDVNTGNFEVTGTITAYFTTVAATEAVRNNADVGFNAIMAANGKGLIYDIPLLQLAGGMLAVAKDKPITVPLTPTGARSKYDHTMLHQAFSYLPLKAMPVAV